QRHPALELLAEFRFRAILFFDPGVEHNGDAPIVLAREFTDHQLRGFGGRLPINVVMMITRKILPDRVKIAPVSLRAAFNPAQQRRRGGAEIIQGPWRRINYYFPVGLQTAPVFNEAEWEPGVNDEATDRVDATFWEATFDSRARGSAGRNDRQIDKLGGIRRVLLCHWRRRVLLAHSHGQRKHWQQPVTVRHR